MTGLKSGCLVLPDEVEGVAQGSSMRERRHARILDAEPACSCEVRLPRRCRQAGDSTEEEDQEDLYESQDFYSGILARPADRSH